VSYGDLRNPDPEGLIFPALRIKRTTASIIHEGQIFDRPWATTFAWGKNDKLTEHTHNQLPAWMLESTIEPRDGDAAFLRAERITHDESTIPLTYSKVSVGYILEVARTGPLRWGVGGLASYLKPAEITRIFYGDRPNAYMLFIQARF
jgi:hypothetical protein